MLLDSFYHARRVRKTAWMGRVDGRWKDLKSALLEIHRTIMAPKCTECQQTYRQAPKWKSANYGLKSRSDEAGIIKRSRGEYMKDQYRFRN